MCFKELFEFLFRVVDIIEIVDGFMVKVVKKIDRAGASDESCIAVFVRFNFDVDVCKARNVEDDSVQVYNGNIAGVIRDAKIDNGFFFWVEGDRIVGFGPRGNIFQLVSRKFRVGEIVFDFFDAGAVVASGDFELFRFVEEETKRDFVQEVIPRIFLRL